MSNQSVFAIVLAWLFFQNVSAQSIVIEQPIPGVLRVSESGLPVGFDVSLTGISPGQAVTLTVEPSDPTEITVRVSGSLTVTDEGQIIGVSVGPVDDAEEDGDQVVSVFVGVSRDETTDPGFLDLATVSVEFINVDNELPDSLTTSMLIDLLDDVGKGFAAVAGLTDRGCQAVPELLARIDEFRPFRDGGVLAPDRTSLPGFSLSSQAISYVLTQATGIGEGLPTLTGLTPSGPQIQREIVDFWTEARATGQLGLCSRPVAVPSLSALPLAILVLSLLAVGLSIIGNGIWMRRSG